jgi:hypothetical protein
MVLSPSRAALTISFRPVAPRSRTQKVFSAVQARPREPQSCEPFQTLNDRTAMAIDLKIASMLPILQG